MKIGIVGHGFVGKAVEYGFSSKEVSKQIIDPIYGNSVTDIDPDTDFIFLCVPTPMGENGKINSSIIESCFEHIKTIQTPLKGIIIKSTVTPDILEMLEKQDARLVYNPEFLTERNAKQDFINPIMHVFGGNKYVTNMVESLYRDYSICQPCPIFHMTVSEASFVKYGINSFLAAKVLWFNQFYDLIEKNGSDFNKIINAIGADARIGYSHTVVPGFDGKKGFGGACFAKDTQALLNFAKNSHQFELSTLREVINSNNTYRSQYELDCREKEQSVNYTIFTLTPEQESVIRENLRKSDLEPDDVVVEEVDEVTMRELDNE